MFFSARLSPIHPLKIMLFTLLNSGCFSIRPSVLRPNLFTIVYNLVTSDYRRPVIKVA